MNPFIFIIIAASASAAIITLLLMRWLSKSRGYLLLTNKKKLSSQLENEQLKSAIIINAIADGVVAIENNGTISLFNPAAVQLTGWLENEAKGLDFHSILPLVNTRGEPYTAHNNPFDIAINTGEVVRDSSALLVTRRGKHLPVSLLVSPLKTDTRKPGKTVVGAFRDISKEKAEEAQRTEFISTASHEMRTPIAAIEGYLSLALNEKVTQIDKNARNYLEKAHASTKHLGRLFQDLLTSSKADDGHLSSYPVVVEVGELLGQVVDDSRLSAQKKGLGISYVFGSAGTGSKTVRPLYFGFVDPNRLREVFQNVIDNGIKYTMAGSVTVTITGDDKVFQIQVKDTGPGIPAEDISHMFQKFYRIDNSMTRSIGGTGLGLFISRKIIELYNGHIWVESQPGKGSVFFITLPRLSAERANQIQAKQNTHMSVLDSM